MAYTIQQAQQLIELAARFAEKAADGLGFKICRIRCEAFEPDGAFVQISLSFEYVSNHIDSLWRCARRFEQIITIDPETSTIIRARAVNK